MVKEVMNLSKPQTGSHLHTNEELVAAIQAGEDRILELWEQVKGLVVWKAQSVINALDQRGTRCGVDLDDLIQSGYIAMTETVHHYAPECGAAFSTCLINRLKNAFAEVAGYRTKRASSEPLNNCFSLDQTVGADPDGAPLGDFIQDPKAVANILEIEEGLWQEQLHETLEAAMAVLPEQNAEVLRLRYYQSLTPAEVGQLEGITAGKVRQIESKAIRQLRQPSVACHLRPFYDFDFYCGSGLEAFRHTGMSIQERFLVIEEERAKRQRKQHNLSR